MREQILSSMEAAMKCTVFDKDIDKTSFSHSQIQVGLERVTHGYDWIKRVVDYECKFDIQENYDSSKPTAIIPIRDCGEIITMCMESMKKTNTFDLINVIIVDDRSTEDIKKIANKYQVSYLRIDHKSTFNFSMLCNLAAKVCHDLGNTQIIMWNADLYVSDKVNLERLLEKHNKNNASLSGTKLLYPPLEYSTSNNEDTENILRYFPQMAGRWRGTIQFGGDAWVQTNGPINSSPIHDKRFGQPEEADVDRSARFVTGAMQVIQLDKFVEMGGYNPSLEKNFQDVDICAHIGDVWYFGKDIEFYHDESPSFQKHNNKQGPQIESDHVLYGLLNNG